MKETKKECCRECLVENTDLLWAPDGSSNDSLCIDCLENWLDDQQDEVGMYWDIDEDY